MYDDFQHLKSTLKDNFPDGNPAWKTIALFPTAEALGSFLSSALTFLGAMIWQNEAMLNFLDNVPSKSFITELRVHKLTKKVSACVTCYLVVLLFYTVYTDTGS